MLPSLHAFNTTPRPIDVLSQQLKDLQSEIKIMKCEIIHLREQIKIKDEKFEIVTKPPESKGWLWY